MRAEKNIGNRRGRRTGVVMTSYMIAGDGTGTLIVGAMSTKGIRDVTVAEVVTGNAVALARYGVSDAGVLSLTCSVPPAAKRLLLVTVDTGT
jgi:hypothetical protein